MTDREIKYIEMCGRYMKRYVPTMREYDNYEREFYYTKGWNDAMDFVFNPVSNREVKNK